MSYAPIDSPPCDPASPMGLLSSSPPPTMVFTQTSFLIRAALVVGSGGLVFGYDIGVISGTLETLKDHFSLDDFTAGLVVSVLYAGSIVGSLLGGPLCDRVGRWRTIQLQNLIFFVGALLTGLATHVSVLCIGRFVVGIASAVSGLADVPYLTEVSPAAYRGVVSGQYEILVGAGIMLSFVLNIFLVEIEHYGWRIAFLLPAVFAALQSLGMFWLPESPKWLITRGRLVEARNALKEIYGEAFLEREREFERKIMKREHVCAYQSEDREKAFSTHSGRSSVIPCPSSSLSTASSAPHSLFTPILRRVNVNKGHYVEAEDREEEELAGDEDLPPDVEDYFAALKAQYLSNCEDFESNTNTNINYNTNNQNNSKKSSENMNSSKGRESDTNDDDRLLSNSSRHNSSVPSFNGASFPPNESSRSISLSQRSVASSLSEVFSSESELMREYAHVITIIVVIQILSQITGANVIRNYAPTIFEENGVSTHTALLYNAALGVVKLVFTVLSVMFVEHGGRRGFFLLGIAVVTVGMIFLCFMSVYFFNGNGDEDDNADNSASLSSAHHLLSVPLLSLQSHDSLTSSGSNHGDNPFDHAVLFTIGCAIVYAGFGIGYGPAPWILSSEMIPTAIRSRIMSISLVACNLAQLVVNFLFLPLNNAISPAGTFVVFVVLNVITFLYVYLYLVETKEVLPREILRRSLERRRAVRAVLCPCIYSAEDAEVTPPQDNQSSAKISSNVFQIHDEEEDEEIDAEMRYTSNPLADRSH